MTSSLRIILNWLRTYLGIRRYIIRATASVVKNNLNKKKHENISVKNPLPSEESTYDSKMFYIKDSKHVRNLTYSGSSRLQVAVCWRQLCQYRTEKTSRVLWRYKEDSTKKIPTANIIHCIQYLVLNIYIDTNARHWRKNKWEEWGKQKYVSSKRPVDTERGAVLKTGRLEKNWE